MRWFNAKHAVDEQLQSFFSAMKGRKERDILIVLDDVLNVEEVIRFLPDHMNCHFVITTASPNKITERDRTYVLPVTPYATAHACTVAGIEDSSEAQLLSKAMGNVPILMEISGKLYSNKAATLDALVQASNDAVVGESFSISKCLRNLVDLAIAHIEASLGDATAAKALSTLACFNVDDLSLPIIDAVGGDEEFPVISSTLGLLSHKWDGDAYSMHPLIASVLRERMGRCAEASEILSRLWPRRMSGKGNASSFLLVWHTVALQQAFASQGAALTEKHLINLDKAATYLALSEGRHLETAAWLWGVIHSHNVATNTVTSDSVRVAKELSKLQYKLGKYELCEQTLKTCVSWSEALVGEKDPSHALLISLCAPLMPVNENSLATMGVASEVLVTDLTSSEAYTGDERRMRIESLIVLLLCTAQTRVDLGKMVPDALRSDIKKWQQALK